MKINVELEILGNEITVEVSAPEEFEKWTDFKQMTYLEEKIIEKINYSWDY